MKIKKTVALYSIRDVEIILEYPGNNREPEYIQISEPLVIEFEVNEPDTIKKLAAMDWEIERLKFKIEQINEKRMELLK